MVKYQTDTLDRTFSALADPTRRAILARLALGEASVGELAAPFEMSLPAVSKHLKVLEDAGLLARRRAGRRHQLRLNSEPMQQAHGWIAQYRQFWEAQFDRLDLFLQQTDDGEDADGADANREGANREDAKGEDAKGEDDYGRGDAE